MLPRDSDPRFHRAHLFPVEGDSAIAELWHDGEVWAEVWLEGLQLDARGEDRVRNASAMVRLYSRPASAEPDWMEYRLDEVMAELTTARDWLLDNERGRVPVEDEGELSAAGRALSTMATADIGRLMASIPPASNPPPPHAGTGAVSLLLIDGGLTPIALIRELRRLTGFGLMDARALLADVPSIVMTGLSPADAEQARQAIEAAGGIAEIR